MKVYQVSSNLLNRFGEERRWFVVAPNKNEALTEVLFYLRKHLTLVDSTQEEDVSLDLRIQELGGPVVEVRY